MVFVDRKKCPVVLEQFVDQQMHNMGRIVYSLQSFDLYSLNQQEDLFDNQIDGNEPSFCQIGTFFLVMLSVWGGCNQEGNILQGAMSAGCTLMVLLASFGSLECSFNPFDRNDHYDFRSYQVIERRISSLSLILIVQWYSSESLCYIGCVHCGRSSILSSSDLYYDANHWRQKNSNTHQIVILYWQELAVRLCYDCLYPNRLILVVRAVRLYQEEIIR